MTQFKYEYLAKGNLLKFKSMKVYAVNFETILQSKCRVTYLSINLISISSLRMDT